MATRAAPAASDAAARKSDNAPANATDSLTAPAPPPDLEKLKRYFTEARQLTEIARNKSLQAINDYLNSTGYQFALNQGLDSVAQTKAAQGLLGSGSLVKALDSYGTGLAQQYGQQYIGNLQNLTSTGAGSANALAGFGQNYAGQVSGNNNTAATAAGNASLTGANAFNSALNNGLQAYGRYAGQTSYSSPGGGTSYNAFAPAIGG